MKLKLFITKKEIIDQLFPKFKDEDIELVVEDEPMTEAEVLSKFGISLPEEEVIVEEPKKKRIPVLEENRFFAQYLKANKLSVEEAAQLCGLSRTTIKRLCKGYHIHNPTYLKVIDGLGLSKEDAHALKRSLTRHQRG